MTTDVNILLVSLAVLLALVTVIRMITIKLAKRRGEIENVLPIPRPKATHRPPPIPDRLQGKVDAIGDAVRLGGVSFADAARAYSSMATTAMVTPPCPDCGYPQLHRTRNIWKQETIFSCPNKDCGWERIVGDEVLCFQDTDKLMRDIFTKTPDAERTTMRVTVNVPDLTDQEVRTVKQFKRAEDTGRLAALKLDLTKPTPKAPEFKLLSITELQKKHGGDK